MKKRDILIITLLTIILIIVLTTTLQKKPQIESIYLSSNKDSDFEELQLNKNYSFDSRNSDIYLIIKVKHLKVNDKIKVEWSKIENDDNNYSTIQKNIFEIKEDGSGKIVILLVKRSKFYSPGKYNVEVYLNDESKISEKFYINSINQNHI